MLKLGKDCIFCLTIKPNKFLAYSRVWIIQNHQDLTLEDNFGLGRVSLKKHELNYNSC